MMRLWDRLEQTLVGLLGLCALAVGVWQVAGRYIDQSLSVDWGDEVIVYLIIWSIMIVSSQLVRHDAHVRPDLVLRLLSAGAQRWLEMFNCLVALAFCGMLVWYGWEIVDTSMMFDEHSNTSLGFPMWLYDLSLPVGAGLMFLRFLMRLIRYATFFDPATMTLGHMIHEAPQDMQLPRAN
jgi:C4-dicarboxylate transporter DctQ subunit